MNDFLARLYLKTRSSRWLYPLYLLFRLPLTFVRLVRQEGLLGAGRWLSIRAGFLIKNRDCYGQPGFLRRSIAPFRSRGGFVLFQPIEYIIYDEIFLDRCYDFDGLAETVRSGPQRFVDFGTHHGLVIDLLRTFCPEGEYYGAEMSPVAYQAACQRFATASHVHLHHVAIGGSPRRERFTMAEVSTEQSLSRTGDGEVVEVDVITPVEFMHRCGLTDVDTCLVKMDIEGAEREVFSNPDCVRPLLDRTRAVLIEIHHAADLPLITAVLQEAGLALGGVRGINYFYRRPAGHQPTRRQALRA